MLSYSASRWFTAAADHLETHPFLSQRPILVKPFGHSKRNRGRQKAPSFSLFVYSLVMLARPPRDGRVCPVRVFWDHGGSLPNLRVMNVHPARPLGEQTSLKSAEERGIPPGVILEIFIVIEWAEFIAVTCKTFRRLHVLVCLPVQI